jgi:plastocyanin
MARDKDSPDKSTGRVLMAVSAGLAIAVFAALLATTEKEHPREEANKERAAERAAEEPSAGGETAYAVTEKEYSVDLVGSTTLHPGPLAFEVKNVGKVPHDLAIEGGGAKEPKTPLIDPGKSGRLQANLTPGKYTLYCTVPGHEQLGMKTEVTVK